MGMIPHRWASVCAVAGLAAVVMADPPEKLLGEPGTAMQGAVIGSPAGGAGPIILDGSPMLREFGPGRFTELLRPDFMRRDLRLFAAQLELDGSQKSIVESLLEDYGQALEAAATKLREAVKQAAPPAPQFARGVGEPGELIGDLHNAVGEQFILPPTEMGGADVTIWEGEQGGANVRIVTVGGAGEGHPPIPMPPPASDGSEQPGSTVEQSVTVNQTPGAEPQVAVKLVARGPDGQNMIPPEVMEKITKEIQARIAQRLRERQAREAGPEGKDAAPEPPKLSTDEIAFIARDFMAEKSRLRDQFVSDMKMMLMPTQLSLWDGLERMLRRLQSAQRSRLSGEHVDLRQAAEFDHSRALDQSTLDQLLSGYEEQLDAALRARDEFLQRAEIDTFLATRGHDSQKRLDLARQEKTLRLGVRAINESGTETIAQVIADPAQADAFRQRVREATYRRVYQPTRTQRAYKAALALDDLSNDARLAISSLQQGYESELAVANAQLVQTTRQHEPDQPIRMIEFIAQMQEQQGENAIKPPEDLVAKGISERSQIGLRYLEQLRGQLTAEQLAKVPAAKAPSFSFSTNGGGGVMRFTPAEAGK